MGRLVKKTAFGAGEVDDALIDRPNLEKVQAGVKTARNVVVAKNGRLLNRCGTLYNRLAKANTGSVIVIEVPNTNYILEVTDLNIRRHDMSAGTSADAVTDIDEAELENIDYCVSSKYAYLTSGDSQEIDHKCVLFFRGNDSLPIAIYDIIDNTWISEGSYIVLDEYLTKDIVNSFTFAATGAPSGPSVEYAVTVVRPDGQECTAITPITGSPNLPVSSGQYNTLSVLSDNLLLQPALEYRFFRRFTNGGAYGYIGSSFDKVVSGTAYLARFVDYGQTPDYSINPPLPILNTATEISGLKPKTGEVIQGRLFIGNCSDNAESVYGSRTNHPFNFLRDFPLSDDSALKLKAGQSGAADVLKIADAGTLVVFTAIGVFAPQIRGPVTPDNSNLNSALSSAIINEKLRPLKVNDNLIFVDKTDNSIKALDFSNNRQNYSSDDLTIYSGHLFEGKEITSWAAQKYGDPIVWCVMDDGSVVAFTYKDSQQLRAFTRADFYGADVVAVTSYGIGADSRIVFLIELDGVRMFVTLAQRYTLSDKQMIFADAAVYKNLPLTGGVLTLTPVGPDGWSGNVRIDSTLTPFSAGMIGKIYRAFDDDGQAIDFEVLEVPASNQMIVGPNDENRYDEVSEQYREGITLYETFTEMTGLSHLNEHDVSVYCDGAVVASPLNDVENLPKKTVQNGTLTVPRSAFCTVGLPMVWDLGTFEIISDDPNLMEKARMSGQAIIRMKNSKGFYVGPNFPEDNSVEGMQPPELIKEDQPQNAALQPQTGKYKVSILTEWESNGAICLRGVDPVAFELLSIVVNVNIS